MDRLFNGLTEAQREAVTHFEGPLLILAGPGSGKTRVVTHRVAWLLRQGVPGRQILALTFTNKAADEMAHRIAQLADDPTVWVGTFHRFCARLLRKYAPLVGLRENYTIYDVGDSGRALRQAIGRLNINVDRFTPESVAKAISWAKNHLIAPAECQLEGHPERSEGSPLSSRQILRFAQDDRSGNSGTALSASLAAVIRDVYPAYQNQLAASNAADFDDLLLHVATILRDNTEVRASLDDRYRFILLDEYQDTNLAQYAIARAMAIDYPNLAVTGDPDQSIYSWRGANQNNMVEFERDYPKVHVVRLERNYRSTQRILRVAADLIAHNIRRKEKGLFTENGPGVPVRLVTYATQKDEADGIAERIAAEIHGGRRRPRDFAIFYRVNALSRAFEFALRDLGVPYQMVNGLEFFQRKEIKDILAYLHLLNNPQDEVALMRVINVPARGIGKTTIARLSDYAVQHGLTLLEAAREVSPRPLGERPGVRASRNRPTPHPNPLPKGEGTVISRRASTGLSKFVALVDRLAAAIDGAIEEILGMVLSETGYQQQLSESEDEEDQERLANIEELLTVARDFDERHGGPGRLEAFLEETCLVNDTDAWETDADRVTLMTLHASKGLEFPVVYLTAVEEGIMPHQRCRDHPEQLEEERRLMFVGITRAQQELQLSTARYRDFRGQRKLTIPSSFLMELPRGEMEIDLAGTESGGRTPFVCDQSDHSQVGPDEQWHETEHVEDHGDADAIECHDDAGVAMQADDDHQRATLQGTRYAVHLTTAAALANGGEPIPPIDPNVFCQGMWVLHAAYGLGQIVALSGRAASRQATVDFPPPAGRKMLLLAEGSLRPVGT